MRRRKERNREMVEDWVFIGWEICRISRFGRVDRDRQHLLRRWECDYTGGSEMDIVLFSSLIAAFTVELNGTETEA
jgi:hypothetical protein